MAALSFLELLDQEASAVEFERPLVEARARGADADELADLARAKLLALKVRGVLEDRRRRESELTALFETARDLTALRDLDSVLQAIVRRARLLLGSDVSYLSLNDEERGGTYMRVTEKIVSVAFRNVELPMGAGLGGLVAQTATPYASDDYFTDERFHHTSVIDEAVREEGIVSIVGVPLALGSQVVGVLYAANRSRRPFSRADVNLLSSLAAHAVVAIDNARLLGETREALDELNATSNLLRAHSASVERAADAHDRFAELVLRGGGVEEVAAALTDILGGSLRVIGADGALLAGKADGAAASNPAVDDPALVAALASARQSGRAVVAGRWTVAAGLAGTEYLGALVLEHVDPPEQADLRIFERAAVVMALLLLFRRSVAEVESRVRGELLVDLLREPLLNPAGLDDRARLLGVDLNRPHCMAVTAMRDALRERASTAASHLASSRSGLAAAYQGRLVLLLPTGDPAECGQALATALARAGLPEHTVGVAGPIGSPAEVAPAFTESCRCHDALLALGQTGQVGGADELGFLGQLLGRTPDLGGFVGRVLGPVLDYDRRRGTDLIATLQAWFACGGHLGPTGAALHIHVNTVGQRLERITRLLGDGWQEPDQALELHLALRLHQALGAAG